MIIGLLICTIGVIPIFLAISVNRVYKGSNLSVGLLLFMLLVLGWQESVGLLYFTELLNQQATLWIFRFLRIAPIYAIPVVFYIAYDIIKNYSATFQSDLVLHKIINLIFTKKMLIALIIWSSFVYIINWTNLGIERLRIEHISISSIEFYFPVYGDWFRLYVIHMCSLIVFLLFLFYIAMKIHNTNIRKFLKGFSIYSLFLFLLGLLNFKPETGIVAGSLGVIIFSILIMIEFIKLNIVMKLNYYQLMERQRKLDLTGNLVGSLIQEVKNKSVMIKGFLKSLRKDPASFNDNQNESLDMII